MNISLKKIVIRSFIILISAVGFSIFLNSCKEKVAIEELTLDKDWQLISSEKIQADGKSLSTDPAKNLDWLDVKVPTTVMGALTDAGVYKDIFFADNLDKIPSAPFEKPWWFRTTFAIDNFNPDQEQLRLFFDGINYRANIWINGVQIASQDTLYGAFKQFEIDITKVAQASNILAVEIIPPVVRDFYMGFVDWAPTPPDKYMAI